MMAKSSGANVEIPPEVETTEAAPVAEATALVNWDKELAEQAAAAATQEASTGGWPFFSTRGGQLTLNKAALPGNAMEVIVLDFIMVNAYYPNAFDPDNTEPPVCYAMGRDEKTMAPKPDQIAEPVAPACEACPHNQFGSKGRGKLCRNTRRLALIPAYKTEADIKSAPVAALSVPPTSVTGFGNYVKNVVGQHKLPPRAIFTKIAVVPDPKVQTRQTFVPVGPIPRELLGAVMARAREVEAVIDFPFPSASNRDEGQATKPPAGKGNDGKGKKRKY
jgi:hypothetical protein